jgi:hypothetical protein
MKMNWQEEFELAMKQFNLPEPESQEFRLHYNENGMIVMCSMVNHPPSYGYIVVDRTTYDNYFKYRVDVDKKRLVLIDIGITISVKLKKSSHGYAVVKNHAGLILETNEVHENIEYYAAIN